MGTAARLAKGVVLKEHLEITPVWKEAKLEQNKKKKIKKKGHSQSHSKI